MSGELKSSQFNDYLGVLNGSWVVVNHLSGGMVEVGETVYRALQENRIPILDENAVRALQQGRFIVPAAFDEVEGIRKIKQELSDSARVVGLQIVPTLACNFSCPYCYENQQENNVYISPEIMDHMIYYVEQAVKPTTQLLNVAWFGGEPLLAARQIETLSRAFMKIASERKIIYAASIITNGYLLSRKNVDMLVSCNAKTIQVTLDGPREIHDRRRVLHDGTGTWQVIVDNLKYAVEQKMSVLVRVNVDKTNIHSLEPFFNEMEREGLLNKVAVKFGAVMDFGNACKSVEDDVMALEELEKILAGDAVQNRLKHSKGYLQRRTPDFIGCVAEAHNSLIVGPSGELYKCSKTIGTAGEIFGHISAPDKQHPNFKKWSSVVNLDNDNCRQCSVLPLCHGAGCAFEFVARGKERVDCGSLHFKTEYLKNLKQLYLSKSKPN